MLCYICCIGESQHQSATGEREAVTTVHRSKRLWEAFKSRLRWPRKKAFFYFTPIKGFTATKQVGWVLSTSTQYKSSTIKSNDLSHLNDLHVEIGSLNESKLIKKGQDWRDSKKIHGWSLLFCVTRTIPKPRSISVWNSIQIVIFAILANFSKL